MSYLTSHHDPVVIDVVLAFDSSTKSLVTTDFLGFRFFLSESKHPTPKLPILEDENAACPLRYQNGLPNQPLSTSIVYHPRPHFPQYQKKNLIQNSWHRSRDQALEDQLNRFQRIIKSVLFALCWLQCWSRGTREKYLEGKLHRPSRQPSGALRTNYSVEAEIFVDSLQV